MTIKVGDRLPAGSLNEYIEVESAECKIGPNEFKVDDLTRGKKVVLFGLPGAFTPTCSAKHVPGYVANYDKLKAKGVSDIVCMSVNDAFVMGAWAKDQKAAGKIFVDHRRYRALQARGEDGDEGDEGEADHQCRRGHRYTSYRRSVPNRH